MPIRFLFKLILSVIICCPYVVFAQAILIHSQQNSGYAVLDIHHHCDTRFPVFEINKSYAIDVELNRARPKQIHWKIIPNKFQARITKSDNFAIHIEIQSKVADTLGLYIGAEFIDNGKVNVVYDTLFIYFTPQADNTEIKLKANPQELKIIRGETESCYISASGFSPKDSYLFWLDSPESLECSISQNQLLHGGDLIKVKPTSKANVGDTQLLLFCKSKNTGQVTIQVVPIHVLWK